MKYFEDFQIGDLIITRGRTVTEADIVNFAYLTGDWHPIHTNAEYAKETVFRERIAHGMFILSLGSGLWANLAAEWDFIAFYGSDHIRFMQPVKIGDTLHVYFEVVGKQEKNERRGIVDFRQLIKNQRQEDVSVMIFRLMIGRKTESKPSTEDR